jgi:membrane fusion protein, multidrug efflux system
MSDQERRGAPRRAWAVWGGVLAVAIGAGAYYAWPARQTEQTAATGRPPAGAAAIPVRVVSARLDNLDVNLRALGTVTALNTVTVRSRASGELVEVLFTEGQKVQAGDLLALIDPRPYEVALEQVLAQQQQNISQYEIAKRDLTRYQNLRKQDSIAPQQVDAQTAIVGKMAGIIRGDQAAVDNARLQLAYTRILAPIPGRLGLRQVDAGNLLSANDPQGLVVITQTQPINVLFTLPEADLPAVRQARQAGEGSQDGKDGKDGKPLEVQVYDRSNTRLLATGQLATIDNQIDVTTGTVKLKAEFENLDDALFPNQFVNVRLRVETLKDVVTLPAAAILQGSQGPFVYVVNSDNTVSVKSVSLGARSGAEVAVLSGVDVGQRVVLEGTDRLRDGSRVRIPEAGGGGRPQSAGKTSPSQ